MQKLIFSLLTLAILNACNKGDVVTISDENTVDAIIKPKGLYASSFGNELALEHPQANGSLIRVKWKDLEPSPGVFDFTSIEQDLATIKSKGLNWSLGLIGGNDSPAWLTNSIGADFFEIIDMNTNVRVIPKIWDPKVNERLTLLAQELASVYNNDDDLVLVYIPQMTANGIEGHFNGVGTQELLDAGLTEDGWVDGVKETATIFTNAFTNKAIAVELHDIMNDTTIPSRVMNELWEDPLLKQRIGVGMWWISGKISYQPNLVDALIDFPGDIYSQAIGRSDQTYRFENDDYTTIFTQAQIIGVRYIELWEYEFVNNTFPQEFEEFNNYANTTYD